MERVSKEPNKTLQDTIELELTYEELLLIRVYLGDGTSGKDRELVSKFLPDGLETDDLGDKMYRKAKKILVNDGILED